MAGTDRSSVVAAGISRWMMLRRHSGSWRRQLERLVYRYRSYSRLLLKSSLSSDTQNTKRTWPIRNVCEHN